MRHDPDDRLPGHQLMGRQFGFDVRERNQPPADAAQNHIRRRHLELQRAGRPVHPDISLIAYGVAVTVATAPIAEHSLKSRFC